MHDSSDSTDQNADADAPDNRAEEIEQLRERLSFYESFDQLIHDNITRAGDLLREAAARKSEGDLALRSATADFEQRQLAERVNYRRVFSGLLDEITIVQQNVERLARQVADALDDLEAVIPAAGEAAGIESDEFPSMPTFSTGSAGELAPGEPVAEQAASLSRLSNSIRPVLPTFTTNRRKRLSTSPRNQGRRCSRSRARAGHGYGRRNQ